MLLTAVKHTRGWCYLITAIHSPTSGYCPDDRFTHTKMHAGNTYYHGTRYSFMQYGTSLPLASHMCTKIRR